MSEAEIVSEIGNRTELLWVMLQWWVSISFAVMVASFWGAKRLSIGIVAVITFMYTLTTVFIFSSMLNQFGFLAANFDALQALRDSGQLGIVGADYLDDFGIRLYLQPLFAAFSFLFTVGFVVYCYKYERRKT